MIFAMCLGYLGDVLGMFLLLAIGMPLGLASAVLAVGVLVMKFEPQLLTAPCNVARSNPVSITPTSGPWT